MSSSPIGDRVRCSVRNMNAIWRTARRRCAGAIVGQLRLNTLPGTRRTMSQSNPVPSPYPITSG